MAVQIWCTSFCNFGHRMHDGKPVAHACYVIPPEALALERDGFTERAIEVIQAAKKYRAFGELSLMPHRGVRAPKGAA
jgi:hypothetical protein